MGHDELAPALEKIGQSLLAIGTIEHIFFLHSDPGQLAPLAIDLIALAR